MTTPGRCTPDSSRTLSTPPIARVGRTRTAGRPSGRRRAASAAGRAARRPAWPPACVVSRAARRPQRRVGLDSDPVGQRHAPARLQPLRRERPDGREGKLQGPPVVDPLRRARARRAAFAPAPSAARACRAPRCPGHAQAFQCRRAGGQPRQIQVLLAIRLRRTRWC